MRKAMPLALACFLLFCGCFGTENLMQPPRPAPQYRQLQNQIDALLTGGLAYCAPLTGEYRQAVQFFDLTGDGEEEAVVFLKSETDIQMLVFLPSGGGYSAMPSVTETAESVHSLAFADFDGNGLMEIVVGWQIAALRSVSVYTVGEGAPAEILSRPYSGSSVYDIEGKGVPALLLIQVDAAEQTGSVEMYAFRNGELPIASSAYLSRGVEAVMRTRTCPLSDGKPGMLITSKYLTTSEVTDVFVFRDDTLVNVTLNMQSGVSDALVRSRSVSAADIDGDGVFDLPQPVELPRYPGDTDEDAFFEIRWSAYDSTGGSVETARTYHSRSNEWYILLPQQWPERYTVRREVPFPAETDTTFSILDEDGTATDFLSICYISRAAGDRTHVLGRTVLIDHTLLLVVAELTPLIPISEADLKGIFYLIPPDWRI